MRGEGVSHSSRGSRGSRWPSPCMIAIAVRSRTPCPCRALYTELRPQPVSTAKLPAVHSRSTRAKRRRMGSKRPVPASHSRLPWAPRGGAGLVGEVIVGGIMAVPDDARNVN